VRCDDPPLRWCATRAQLSHRHIDGEHHMPEAQKLDHFSNLAALVLDQNYAETAGVKKLLRTVPVRRPNSQDFVRTHPELRLSPAALVELKEDRELYLVAPLMVAELTGEFFTAALHLTINSQGTVSLWPVRLPGPDGKHLEWHRSAGEAAELAKTKWLRIKPNMNLGAYEMFEAENENIPEPVWPEQPFEEILRVAFRDRFIDNPEHPVVKRLRGEL
jgi:hypothetical protein